MCSHRQHCHPLAIKTASKTGHIRILSALRKTAPLQFGGTNETAPYRGLTSTEAHTGFSRQSWHATATIFRQYSQSATTSWSSVNLNLNLNPQRLRSTPPKRTSASSSVHQPATQRIQPADEVDHVSANINTTMDNFFRIEKPVANKPPRPQKPSTPHKHLAPQRPKLQEWADVISKQAEDIHISTLSDDEMEQVLRLFDLNPAYGPFVGIDREFRWQRAFASGLHPPELVKRIIDSGQVVQQREAGQLW